MIDRSTISIRTFTLGPFETNCYIVSEKGSPDCFIVDAGFDSSEMTEAIHKESLRPVALVLTHAHLDHIAGVSDLVRDFPGLPIWIHAAEKDWLTDSEVNLSALIGMPVTAPPADRLLQDGDTLALPGGTWKVLHTPGHSPGGITLWNEDKAVAIVGDALFAGSIGRTDFPGCSLEELSRSIRTKIYTMPGETRCFPGHGPTTMVSRERATNPFVRA